MSAPDAEVNPRVACDAMFGGVARWLRLFGVDASYTPGIDDGVLVREAEREGRVVISSDHKLFERRVFAEGVVRGVLVPVGLGLESQVEYVMKTLDLRVREPRCTQCNGELEAVSRGEVADVVPARSLIWVRDFFRCSACGHVFWEGSHWRRIRGIRERFR